MSIYLLYTKIMNIATFFRQLVKQNSDGYHEKQGLSQIKNFNSAPIQN